MGRLLNLWTQEMRGLPSHNADSYFQGQNPMDALAGLQQLHGGAQGAGQDPLQMLRFLQLGNQIQGEMGHGQDDQVMQLIQALLGPGGAANKAR